MSRAPFVIPSYGNPDLINRFAQDGLRIVDNFFELLYFSAVWVDRTRWRGIPIAKLPTDLWVYQELLFDLQPDLIIETGTAHGGSAAFMAAMLDCNQRGRIITIDPHHYDNRPSHPRVEYWNGSSTDPVLVERLKPIAAGCATVMVVLDSAHSTDHVRSEIALYAPLVTLGSYLIVEDGFVDGNPLVPNYVDQYDSGKGGPQTAIQELLATSDAFQVDVTRHKFLVTFNPNGYLKRIK
jgi:cephalosporin hydroxylase